MWLYDWSRDGWLVYNARGEDGSWDVWAKNLDGSEEPQPIVQSPFLDVNAAFSPDRRWVVYLSDASGRSEVYATPFPNSGRRYQISTSGGTDPVWSREGDRIFYISESRTTLMAVDVATEPEFRAGAPRELFAMNFRASTDRDYDVAPDGERFAVLVQGAGARHQINVVVNWFHDLNERVPIE